MNPLGRSKIVIIIILLATLQIHGSMYNPSIYNLQPVVLTDNVNTDNSRWNQTYGGIGNDYGWSLCETSDGGIALIGYTSTFGSGLTDIWLVKLDSQGNPLFDITFGGMSDDVGIQILETYDGGLALLGSTRSLGCGGWDFLLIKTDKDGNHVFNQTYGGPNDDYAWTLSQLKDGGFIIGGQTNSFGAGDEDFFIIKTDSLGSHQWNKTFGGAEEDILYSSVSTSNGGIVLCGSTKSYGAGDEDIYFLKLNNEGSVVLNITYGGSYKERGRAVIQTEDGGYLIGGHSRTADTDPYGNITYVSRGYDMQVIKINCNGTELWNRTYGGSSGDYLYSITNTSQGFLLGGQTESFGAGTMDYWLVHIDNSGEHLWNRSYGGAAIDFAYTVITTVDGNFAFFGHTNSFGSGGFDYWLVKDNFNEPDHYLSRLFQLIPIVAGLAAISLLVVFTVLARKRRTPKST